MRVGILTASDTRTPATDESGRVVKATIVSGHIAFER